MNNIVTLKKKINKQASEIKALRENSHDKALIQQADEFVTTAGLAIQSLELRNDVPTEIKEECRKAFESQDTILEAMVEFGELLARAMNYPHVENSDEYNNVVEHVGRLTPKYQAIVEGMVKANVDLTRIEVRPNAVTNKFDKSVLDETARRFAYVSKFTQGLADVFKPAGKQLKEATQSYRKSINALNEAVIRDDQIKGGYRCVVQPGVAIFGVGKTSEEAWKDAKQWVDDTDENWKDSFEEMECSEKLYNFVSEFGTPNRWDEYDGIAVLPEELDELEEAIKHSKI